MQKVRAEIHLNRIKQNALAFSRLSDAKLCAVVKADAYGHGAEEIACALNGIAEVFAVALVDEGLKIRTAVGGKDILVLTPPLAEEEIYEAGKSGFILTVSDLYTAKWIVKVCKKYQFTIRVHLKGNTGMNRYGMTESELGKTCKYLSTEQCVCVEGFYSHLYTCDQNVCEEQRQKFIKQLSVCKKYFPNIIAHLSATYGALLGKTYAFDMVRVGIGLYGYLPDGGIYLPNGYRLKKAMSVYAYTQTSRKCSFGGLGYGKEACDDAFRQVSIVRFGYADGFLRTKKNGVCGFEKNANNLCMDACIRCGRSRRGQKIPVMMDADDTARVTDTISYEVLCSATRRAERIYDYDD